MLTALKKILESSGGPAPEEEILSFSDYLELVKTEPWITRNTFGCNSHTDTDHCQLRIGTTLSRVVTSAL